MNVLIVHAHPEPHSFTAAMKDAAVETLSRAGHAVVVSDLYAQQFDPVASAADFGDRADPDYLVYALEQRHGYETGTLAPDITAEIEKLKRCDLLLLTFPLFWFSVPAILKGWIDRVLISGLTYGGKRFYDRGGLVGKKGTLGLTLGARPHMFGPDAIHGEIETMLRPLLRGTLYYTGMDVLPPFYAWHVPYIGHEARSAILDGWRRHLLHLKGATPLTFPRLDEFDDRLYPMRPRPSA
ncbi:MAG: NAD(P)H-dependent oxidoreductase [Rhodospirillales bacterium]